MASPRRDPTGLPGLPPPPCRNSTGGGAHCNPRIVLATRFELQWGWLGSGIFWEHARHIYTPVGEPPTAYIARAAAVRAAANMSARVFYSLEKVGFTARHCGVDWGLSRNGRESGLLALAQRYDLVLAYAPILKSARSGLLRRPGLGKVVILLDEPPPFTHPDAALADAERIGACSKCVFSNFMHPKAPHPRVRHFPPPYEEARFFPYVRASEAREPVYFMAKVPALARREGEGSRDLVRGRIARGRVEGLRGEGLRERAVMGCVPMGHVAEALSVLAATPPLPPQPECSDPLQEVPLLLSQRTLHAAALEGAMRGRGYRASERENWCVTRLPCCPR